MHVLFYKKPAKHFLQCLTILYSTPTSNVQVPLYPCQHFRSFLSHCDRCIVIFYFCFIIKLLVPLRSEDPRTARNKRARESVARAREPDVTRARRFLARKRACAGENQWGGRTFVRKRECAGGSRRARERETERERLSIKDAPLTVSYILNSEILKPERKKVQHRIKSD